MRALRVVVAVTAGLVVLGACGGGGSAPTARQPLPKAWPASARREAEGLAARLHRQQPDACAQVRFLDPPTLDPTRARYGWNVAPRALGECDLGDGAIEIGVFANARDRAAFVDERTDGLCRRAAALQAPVPPFVWLTKDDWSMQFDRKAQADRAVRALGGEVSVRPCNLDDRLGWTPKAVATLRAFEGPLANATKCGGLALVDRRTLVAAGAVRTPSAVASCVITSDPPGNDRNVLLAAFQPGSQPRDQFVEEVLTSEGACTRPLTAVTGTRDGVEFAVLGPSELAPQIATAVGGQVGRACGA